jgi:hypothetical protein
MIVADDGSMLGAQFPTTDVAQIKAMKVHVNVNAAGRPPLSCAGKIWPIGATDAVLDTDVGATGLPQYDGATGGVKRIYTLEGKLAQLFTLEGRRRMGATTDNPNWHVWSDVSPQGCFLQLTVVDVQRFDGQWASDLTAQAAAAKAAALAAAQAGK